MATRVSRGACIVPLQRSEPRARAADGPIREGAAGMPHDGCSALQSCCNTRRGRWSRAARALPFPARNGAC
jgi:hypothetical protein